jgi:hemerythrin
MGHEDELVSWSSQYASGVKIVDEQHKELLNLTNDLFNHCVGDPEKEKEYFKSVIHSAVDYVKNHFATEERMMISTKFSGYDHHKREHDKFVLTIVDTIKEFNETRRLSLFKFTKFLKNWVLTHIAVEDKKYFDYFKRIASIKKDGRLTISKTDVERATR